MQRNPLYAYTPKKFTTRTFNSPEKWEIKWKKRILWILCSLIFLWIAWAFAYIQIRILKDLPDVSEVKNMTMSQATIITDRNWEELYKIFSENREFVPLSDINQHMIDAIIAVEDQKFWEHEGLDPIWIFRAWFKTMIGQNAWWGSTITQQLITNVMNLKRPFWGTFLQKVDYKLKQIILAKRLNNVLQKQIKAENKNLSSSEVKEKMKEKILELYLNYVFLGNNAYWVEAASKTYFWKSAKDINIIESAILAAIPKAPTTYDPYKSKSLMGIFKITDWNWKEYPFEWNIKSNVLLKYRDMIKGANFSNKNTSESFIKFIISLCPNTITVEWKTYNVKYVNWRAEFALWRIYEEGKITEEELKNAFLESLTMEFKKKSFDIKAPHFVFWIKDLLEKEYGSWITAEWWLIVKTTLDYNIQKLAESALINNGNSFFENWATNGSMLYTDTTNWDVLAYVWSLDYFNNEIQGQNDMVRNPRQSWSSIKPLIYALWFEKLPLTLDTPIYDIEFKAGKDTPHNADWAFEWPIPLKKALWFSRNIPAVKLFIALWWEEVAKPFLQSLWLEWIKNNIEYWYPLALGAWEVSMLQMAEAYSNLTREKPAKINPILEIKNNNWEILYKKEVEEKNNIIPAWVISLMWKILSDPSNRIWAWATKFNVKWLTYALKTWTSNVVTDKWSRPRDWWLAAYTPSKVILMWAGNANAAAMNRNAFWGTIHANSIKAFLSSLLENNYLSNEEMPIRDVVSLKISKISGKIPAENTPADLIIDTMWFNGHVPWEVEWPVSELEIDTSCYWKVSPLTPNDQIKKGYLIQAYSFMPGNNDLEDIKKYHREQAMSWNTNLFVEEPTNYCEEREPQTNDSIEITFIRPQNKQTFAKKNNVAYSIKSPIAIKKINITLDGDNIKSFIDNSTEIYWSKEIDLSNYENWNHTLWITAIDNNNATKSVSTSINIVSEDTEVPYFNKEWSTVIKNEDWSFNVTLLFDDNISWVKNWIITDTNWWNINKFNGQATNFSTTNNIIKATVEDFYWNKLEQEINLSEF